MYEVFRCYSSIKNDRKSTNLLSKTKVFNNKNLDKDRLVIKNKIKKFKEKIIMFVCLVLVIQR